MAAQLAAFVTIRGKSSQAKCIYAKRVSCFVAESGERQPRYVPTQSSRCIFGERVPALAFLPRSLLSRAFDDNRMTGFRPSWRVFSGRRRYSPLPPGKSSGGRCATKSPLCCGYVGSSACLQRPVSFFVRAAEPACIYNVKSPQPLHFFFFFFLQLLLPAAATCFRCFCARGCARLRPAYVVKYHNRYGVSPRRAQAASSFCLLVDKSRKVFASQPRTHRIFLPVPIYLYIIRSI